MLGFLIVILLIHLILYKPSNNLACGLFGYAGSTPPDIDKIKILGILNEERGSHSAGVYIGSTVLKDTGKFTRLIQTNNLYDEVFEPGTGKLWDVDMTVIGHTRSPSPGTTTTKESAHPFEIYSEEDKNETEALLVGAHNGTIKNWKPLCEEFKIDHTKIGVDSKGLLAILATKKYDVLNKYDGGAALLWTYPKQINTLFVFKGASKTYIHGPHYDDKPLFYWKTRQNGKDAIYISSIQDSLLCIGGDKTNIFPFEANVIYMIVNGKLMKHKFEVKRETAFPTTTSYTPNNNATKNYKTDWEDTYRNGYGTTNTVSKVVNINPLFNQIPFLQVHSTSYSKGLKTVYNASVDTIFEQFDHQLGGRVYYGKNSKMYRNGHILGAIIPRDKASLDTFRSQKRIKEFTKCFLDIATTYKLDRHGFVKGSNYSMFRLDDDYTEYLFIDGNVILKSNENDLDRLIKFYYDNDDDLESLASCVLQPIILPNKDNATTCITVLFNTDYTFRIGTYSIGVLIPFANAKAYFDIYESNIRDINVAKAVYNIKLDYSYSSVCIDNTKENKTLIYEYAYMPKEDKIVELDKFQLYKGSDKREPIQTVLALPETTVAENPTYECDLPFKTKETETKVEDEDAESILENTVFALNLKADINRLDKFFEDATDISEDMIELLRKLEIESSINTAEATKALNSFTSDMKLAVSQFEDYREDFANSFAKLESTYKELNHDEYDYH